jgi:hypothetical protein
MSATEHHTISGERGWLFVQIVATLGLTWLLMQAVHECGHVLHAWASGGTAVRVVLHPLEISRTDVSPNPHPQFVAWGGAVWGCLIPLGLLAAVRIVEWRDQRHFEARPSVFQTQASGAASAPRFFAWLVRFFGGFCLIANGGYLAAGPFDGIGDAGDLLNNGAPSWSLIVFGAVTIPVGLWLWHGLGPRLGLGSDTGPVSRRGIVAVLAALIVVVVAELVGGRK